MVVVIFGLGTLCVPPLRAQTGASAVQAAKAAGGAKATPRTADGHPDLSGFYNLGDVYSGDVKEEKPGQHVVVRSADGSGFFDYGAAAGGNATTGSKIPPTVNMKSKLLAT